MHFLTKRAIALLKEVSGAETNRALRDWIVANPEAARDAVLRKHGFGKKTWAWVLEELVLAEAVKIKKLEE